MIILSKSWKKFLFFKEAKHRFEGGDHLPRRIMQITQYGIESILNLGVKIWDLLPAETEKVLRFLFWKLENGLLKNNHATFVRHMKILVKFDFILDICWTFPR